MEINEQEILYYAHLGILSQIIKIQNESCYPPTKEQQFEIDELRKKLEALHILALSKEKKS